MVNVINILPDEIVHVSIITVSIVDNSIELKVDPTQTLTLPKL